MGPTETRRRRSVAARHLGAAPEAILFATAFNNFPALENGAATTTVDHADIRGLFTACLAFVVELPLAKGGSLALWPIP
jgi:hypothetical protein